MRKCTRFAQTLPATCAGPLVVPPGQLTEVNALILGAALVLVIVPISFKVRMTPRLLSSPMCTCCTMWVNCTSLECVPVFADRPREAPDAEPVHASTRAGPEATGQAVQGGVRADGDAAGSGGGGGGR